MILEEIEKSTFVQINDKRYCFSDGIVSLFFSHLYLLDIVQFKRDKKKTKNWIVFARGKTQIYSNGKICSGKKQQNFHL